MILRIGGLGASTAYAAFVVWLYMSQPQTVAEVAGGVAAGIGTYSVDAQAAADGMEFFRREQYPEARAALMRADSARRDARTQFYIAYSFYREGWGRVYNDDQLFRQGIEAVDRAISLAPNHRFIANDPSLGMQSADELKAELERGVAVEASDYNPLKVFRRRK